MTTKPTEHQLSAFNGVILDDQSESIVSNLIHEREEEMLKDSLRLFCGERFKMEMRLKFSSKLLSDEEISSKLSDLVAVLLRVAFPARRNTRRPKEEAGEIKVGEREEGDSSDQTRGDLTDQIRTACETLNLDPIASQLDVVAKMYST